MLCQTSNAPPMDTTTSQGRIFQERTNFRKPQMSERPGMSPQGSRVKSMAAQLENTFGASTASISSPQRRKSGRKMLRSAFTPFESASPRSSDVAQPVRETRPTAQDEPLGSAVDAPPVPLPHPPQSSNKPPASQRVLADHVLLSASYDSVEADHKLKVEALTRITSSLSAKASDAKQGVERLRKLLADRAVEPSIYEATQRERWMEERRQVATEELLKTVRDHLKTLVQSPGPPPSKTRAQPLTEIATAPSPVSSPDANLHIFLTASHRYATRSRRRRAPLSLPEDAFNRIRHHKQLLPLRLKVPTQRPFAKPVKGSGLPTSKEAAVAVTGSEKRSSTSTGGKSAEPGSPSPLSATATLPPTSPVPLLASIPEDSDDPHSASLVEDLPATTTSGNGTATIWRSAPLRTKEQILAEARMSLDTDADVPNYFQSLIAELDATPIARVRLNSLRPSASVASFPRRPMSTPSGVRGIGASIATATGRATPKRNSHTESSANAHRPRMSTPARLNHTPNNTTNTEPTSIPARTTTTTTTTTTASPIPTTSTIKHLFSPPPAHIHTPAASSPSKRRISALFSLSDVIPSRRSLHVPHRHSHSYSHSPHPPTLAEIPPISAMPTSVQFTIPESTQEEVEDSADKREEHDKVPNSQSPPQEDTAPIPSNASLATLTSVATNRDAPHPTGGVNSNSSTEEKMLTRLKKRVSAALGRQ